MFEETRKYSEDTYIDKAQLAMDYEGSILETVWRQIQEYRSLFYRRYPFAFFKGNICFCPQVMKRLFQISVRLYQQTSGQQDRCPWDTQLKAWAYEVPYPYADFIAFLKDEEEPCLVRLFFLKASKLPQSEQWQKALLYHEGWLRLMPYVKAYGVVLDQADATHAFLAFLTYIETWVQEQEQLSAQRDLRKTTLETLQLSYPAVREQELRFYVDHRQMGCYYTIRQYKEACGVCYETARKAMEELTALGWYQRCKVGKKFVYRSV